VDQSTGHARTGSLVALGLVAVLLAVFLAAWWHNASNEALEAQRKQRAALMSLSRHSEHVQDLHRIGAGRPLPSREELRLKTSSTGRLTNTATDASATPRTILVPARACFTLSAIG